MVPIKKSNPSWIALAVWTGLEPATSCVTGRHSNQTELPDQPEKELPCFALRLQKYNLFRYPQAFFCIFFALFFKPYIMYGLLIE